MKIEVNVEKRYAVLIFIGLVLLAGSWVVYAVDTSQGWHSWGQVSDKPDINQCNGANQALKTINLDTGAVTCEADDAGGSSDWDSITGKPAGFADDVDNVGSDVVFDRVAYVKIDSYYGGADVNYIIRKTLDGIVMARVISWATCGNTDSGWKSSSWTHDVRVGGWNCHRPGSHTDVVVTVTSDYVRFRDAVISTKS